MEFYCTYQFKREFERLLKNNSYAEFEKDMIDFLKSSLDEVRNAIRIGGSDERPFLKKRIAGRSGYRVYYLFIIIDGRVYFSFVHPKTGSKGADNIKKAAVKPLIADVVNAIAGGTCFKVCISECGSQIRFI